VSQFIAILSAFLVVIACSVDTQYSGDGAGNAAYNSKDSKADKKSSSKKKKSKSSSEVEEEEEEEVEEEEHEHTEMPAGSVSSSPSPTVVPSPTSSPSASPSASPSPSPTAVLGLKNVTRDPTDPTMAVFVVKAGTGTAAYNTLATMIEIDRAQGFNKLKLVNMDNVNHVLHTGGAPCGHQDQNAPTPPGGSYVCNLNQVIDPGANQPTTYNHLSTRANSPLFLKVIN
jgi:hypothetical protein